jgi:hypothetical protein
MLIIFDIAPSSARQMSYSRNQPQPIFDRFPLGGSEKGHFQHPPPVEAFFDANKHPDERISSS